MSEFDLDVQLRAVPIDEAGIAINLPYSLLDRLAAMTEMEGKSMDENICILCSWEVGPDESCNCGVLGGYVAVPYHVVSTGWVGLSKALNKAVEQYTDVGAWPAAEVFEWLQGMGYEWNGETWHKSSQ